MSIFQPNKSDQINQHVESKAKVDESVLLLPAIFIKSKEALERMVVYTRHTTPGTSYDQMIALVKKGEDIANRLFDPHCDFSHPQVTKQDAIAFMWYLMSKAAVKGEEYEKGMMVCIDTQADKILEFLQKCGQTSQNSTHSYKRVSSHFGKETEGPQWGLDIREEKSALPANMKTLLFGKLKEGGCFIKMETSGFPLLPFIKALLGKDKYAHFKEYGLKECLTHTLNYLKFKLGIRDGGGDSPYMTHRETENHIDFEEVSKAYRKLMVLLGVPKREVDKAISDGLEEMQNKLETILNHIPSSSEKQESYQACADFINSLEGHGADHNENMPLLGQLAEKKRLSYQTTPLKETKKLWGSLTDFLKQKERHEKAESKPASDVSYGRAVILYADPHHS